MKVDSSQRFPIKVWASDIDLGSDSDQSVGTLAQARDLANLPMLYKWVALMPDAHPGLGMPIGGVIALDGCVISNAVGMDIGCGMLAVKTNFCGIPDVNILTEIHKQALGGKDRIAVGLGSSYAEPCDTLEMPNLPQGAATAEHYENARHQLGTLGAGNHFIEIQVDQDNYIWFMVHSGSRNLGAQICKHYSKKAKEFHEEWYIEAPSNLGWFPVGSEQGRDYLEEMEYALEFAHLNRQGMMSRMMSTIRRVFRKLDGFEITFDDAINIHHNFAKLENHYGKNVWVHRKGATAAYDGQLGIVPGDMGSPSYIVEGKGNPESFKSCAHGAGRTMSRTEFNRSHTLEAVSERLKGVIYTPFKEHSRTGNLDISEAPGAYKDISQVMKDQKDLVEVVAELHPLVSMKG